jgi:hypothetical protein
MLAMIALAMNSGSSQGKSSTAAAPRSNPREAATGH